MQYTTPRMNSGVSYGLWVIMMCQCRLSLVKKKKMCHMESNVDDGKDMTMWGQTLYFPLNFLVSLKSALKHSLKTIFKIYIGSNKS